RGAARAIDFYKKAFGAVEKGCTMMSDGKTVMHAELQIGDSMFMLADEFPNMGSCSPETYKGSPVVLHLYVPDVDDVFGRAVAAGARVRMPASDMFWGDRYGKLVDPFGHEWSLATHKEDLTREERDKRARDAMAAMASKS